MHTHPIQFDVDYPDRALDRASTAFRLLLALPIVAVLAAIGASGTAGAGIALGIMSIPPMLLIVFRQKYPRWWFDFNVAYLGFHNRVHLHVPYPDVEADLNRWLPLVKWFLAIPHYLALLVLSLGVVLGVIGAWFAILVTGRYPRGLFRFIVGVMRWHNRVIGYAFTLTTDTYPPFRLAA